MGLFDLFRGPGIDAGVKEFNETEGAYLLDVRTPQEYRQGHVPKAKNVPLQQIQKARSVVKDQNAPVFCYCASGARSAQATRALRQMGYTDIRNIGGISGYRGEVEK